MNVRLINRPCTIRRRVATGEKDRYRNAKVEDVIVETVCEVQQQRRVRGESQEGLSDTTWAGYFRPTEEIGSGDAVEVLDLGVFEVIGEPWVARDPRTGRDSHIEATLRRTVGPGDEQGS